MFNHTQWIILVISLLVFTSTTLADNQANQQRMDLYYSPDNIIAVTITMDSNEWGNLKNQNPQGGNCNNEYTGQRYTWFEADSLSVQVTNPGDTTYNFSDIGIKKKSYCGSISNEKPSLNINIAKYVDSNENAAEDTIGSKYLTLNNSKQDPSILKQCFGYYLFRQAGLATSRCNFSSVSIYTPDNNTTEYLGIYINVEPIKKKYFKNVKNGFTASDTGNLYEFSDHDFNLTGILYDDYKGFSDNFMWQDFALAAEDIQSKGVTGVYQTIDVNQFNRFWAMEAIIQHYDGYTRNINNSYAYNDNNLEDADALDESNTNFKFSPWGIDTTFNSQSCWQIYRCSTVASTLFNTSKSQTNVIQAFNDIMTTFTNEQDAIDDYINTLSTSASLTWTGYDLFYGNNGGTINQSAADLTSWMASAIANAVSSIDDGENNSCYLGCPMNARQ